MQLTGGQMSKRNLLPPWRDLQPDGTLGAEYGPRSLSSYQRHIARHKDWSYKPPKKGQRKRDWSLVVEWMTLPDGSIREEGVTERELFVYLECLVKGYSMNGLATRCQVNRNTIKGYLRRLEAKALAHRAEGGHGG